MSDLKRSSSVVKDAVREALHEWLDEKYAAFGRWSFHGLVAACIGGMVFAFLWSQGWHK